DIPGKGVLYRVRMGRFATMAAAKAYGERLRQKGVMATFYAAEYEEPDLQPKSGKGILLSRAPTDRSPQTREASAETPKASQTATATQPPDVTSQTTQAASSGEAKATKTSITTPAPSSPAPGFTRFEDKAAGYAF